MQNVWDSFWGNFLIDDARHLPPPNDDDDNSITSFQAFLRQADKDLDTALHAAVKYGHLDIVKLLVEADPSDTHIQNGEGKTPMYIAVEKGLGKYSRDYLCNLLCSIFARTWL